MKHEYLPQFEWLELMARINECLFALTLIRSIFSLRFKLTDWAVEGELVQHFVNFG